MKMHGVRITIVFVLVSVAGLRAGASEPDEAKRREAVRRALGWLVKMIENKDWAKIDVSTDKANADERKVATLATAWLLEANADFSEFDQALRRRFRDRADRLCEVDESVSALDDSSNWILGFAAFYAYERSLRDGKPHPALDLIARKFLDRQNKEGGWCHGKGTPAPFYSRTMIVTTDLALFALGAAERERMAVCKEERYKKAVSAALKLLNSVQAADGGMPYGQRPHRIAHHPMRTAALLAALAALGQTDSELFRRAARYVQRNVEGIPKEAESAALNLALGALGCYVLSDDVWKRYEGKVLKGLLKKQRPDGSFQIEFPAYIKAYVTSVCAAALGMDQTRVARQLRKSVSSKKGNDSGKLKNGVE